MNPSMNIAMSMAPEWTTALLAWPVILAETLIFGSAILCVMLRLSSAGRTAASDSLARALASWWRMFALIAAALSLLMFVDQVAGMADVSWRGALPLLSEVLARTQGGHIWEWRLPVTAGLLIAAWVPMCETARAPVLSVFCAALFLAGSMMSHAIDFGVTAIAVRFIHTLAAGVWAGALFGYWVAARLTIAEDHLDSQCARTLSKLATWSVALLIASGVYLAYEGLGHSLYHLRYSSYGRVLCFKVELFALVLAVGAYNRVYLIPTIEQAAARVSLLRNVSAESLMIVGVIGLAALLAATPPARMSMTTSKSKNLLRHAELVFLSKPHQVSNFSLVKMRTPRGENLVVRDARVAR